MNWSQLFITQDIINTFRFLLILFLDIEYKFCLTLYVYYIIYNFKKNKANY